VIIDLRLARSAPTEKMASVGGCAAVLETERQLVHTLQDGAYLQQQQRSTVECIQVINSSFTASEWLFDRKDSGLRACKPSTGPP